MTVAVSLRRQAGGYFKSISHRRNTEAVDPLRAEIRSTSARECDELDIRLFSAMIPYIRIALAPSRAPVSLACPDESEWEPVMREVSPPSMIRP